MTNKEWLDYLAHNASDELSAWFDAERTESPTSDTMRHIGQIIEDTVMRGVYGDTESENADSRDKLEADVRKIVEAYNMDTQRHGSERFAHELFYSIIHLIDRQASITSHQWESYHNGMMREWMAKTEELQAQVDELQERLNRTAGKWARTNKKCNEYREKFSKCLDYADAIHALMDDEGMA